MQTFQVSIEPVSPGTMGGASALRAGTGQYATTPAGERITTLAVTQAQMTGLQGYLVLIKAGTNTSAIETAITAAGPT